MVRKDAVAIVNQEFVSLFVPDGLEATERLGLYDAEAAEDRLCAEELELVPTAIELCRKKLRKPTFSKAEYVALLVKNRCQSLAETMAALWKVDYPSLTKDGSLTYASDDVERKKPAIKAKSGKKASGSLRR
jgi:hypothetical protein